MCFAESKQASKHDSDQTHFSWRRKAFCGNISFDPTFQAYLDDERAKEEKPPLVEEGGRRKEVEDLTNRCLSILLLLCGQS